jgi:hypothetical protein
MDRELGRGLRSRAQERRGFSSGGAVGFCAVLDWALAFAGGESAEKSRGLFLVRVFTT